MNCVISRDESVPKICLSHLLRADSVELHRLLCNSTHCVRYIAILLSGHKRKFRSFFRELIKKYFIIRWLIYALQQPSHSQGKVNTMRLRALFACTIASLVLTCIPHPLRAQIFDPSLANNWVESCLALARVEGRGACSPDGGGPHGANCLHAPARYQRCSHIPITGGTIIPKYLIAGVVYAPPGCTSTATTKCGVSSSVAYQGESSLGTKISVSKSVKQGVTARASVDVSLTGISFNASQSEEFSVTNVDSSSVSITKSKIKTLTVPANGDGIDHNQDKIYILLNPVIAMEKLDDTIEWNLGHTQQFWVPYELPVAYLRPGATIPSSVQTVLNAAHLNQEDFTDILKADPLATVAHPIVESDLDKGRYFKVLTMDYEPAQLASDCNGGICNCTQVQNTFKNTLANEQSSQVIDSSTSTTTVGATLEQKVQAEYAGVETTISDFKEGLSVSGSLTYTSSSTNTNSQSDSNSATVTISCASPSWTGQTIVDVYWDATYGSFAFVLRDPFPTEQLLATEQLDLTASRARRAFFPEAHSADLYYGDQKLQAVIGKNGKLRFYGKSLVGISEGLLHVQGSFATKVIKTTQ